LALIPWKGPWILVAKIKPKFIWNLLVTVNVSWRAPMCKSEVKSYLIIAFVVVELLSMVFNFYWVKIPLIFGDYNFNFSVVFFCLGFFIVDIIADQFSPAEANQFIYYKLSSQVLFWFWEIWLSMCMDYKKRS
jgi:uncharacterized PurR-regulated membrane protein YhhQ (DUF165 family)